MNPVKKIWFDENSTPPKNMIWYRGEGKFYEWKNNDWVLCYNLVDVATQEQMEQNNYVIARVLNDLNNRLEALENAPAAPQTHVLEVLSVSAGNESEVAALARLKLDGEAATKEALAELNQLFTIVTYGGMKLSIGGISVDDYTVRINGGYIVNDLGNIDRCELLDILIAEDASHVIIHEL